MLIFKQTLAFAMYGTAAWLVWVLAQQAGANAVAAVLAAMVATGFGPGSGESPRFSPRGRGICSLVTLIAIAAALSCLFFLKASTAQANGNSVNVSGIPSEPYSGAPRLAARCQKTGIHQCDGGLVHHLLVNDEAALSSARVHDAFRDGHIVYLVATGRGAPRDKREDCWLSTARGGGATLLGLRPAPDEDEGYTANPPREQSISAIGSSTATC